MKFEVVHEGRLAGHDGPRISVWIQCYNHEPYVAASLCSALAQSIQPIEIFISDDRSTDRTFQVVCEVAAAYRGPNRVSLFQPDVNLDTLDHFTLALPMLWGDYVIWQSSDDVAEADRARVLSAALIEGGAAFAWSNHFVADADGAVVSAHHAPGAHPTLTLEDFAVGRQFDFSFGGTFAFARHALQSFGPFPRDFGSRGLEHYVALRGALAGGCRYVPDILLRKRYHDGSLTIGRRGEDRAYSPLRICRERLRRRMEVLGNLHRQAVAEPSNPGREPRARLAEALMLQVGFAQLRTMQLAEAAGKAAPAPPPYDPSDLVVVGSTPSEYNICAHECLFFAVPQSLGPIESCLLRNGHYGPIVSARSQADLIRRLDTF